MLNSVLFDELKRREEFLQSIIISDKYNFDNTDPKERLRCSNSKWGAEYYHVTSENAPFGKYISKNDLELAASLAQKDYDRKILQLAAAEYNSLHSYLRKYSEAGIETLKP